LECRRACFGSALNLNPHLHMLFLDGACAFRGKRTVFHRACRPTCDELNRLLDTLSRRIVRVLERRGLLIADPEYPSPDWVPDSSLDHLQAASVAYRIAIGPHAGRKALTRFHGVFAPNFKHRKCVVPRRSGRLIDSDNPPAPMSWMQRLKRVFAVDIETCPERRLRRHGGLRIAQEALPTCRSRVWGETAGHRMH
jgi:hypothetical protein